MEFYIWFANGWQMIKNSWMRIDSEYLVYLECFKGALFKIETSLFI